MTTHHTWLEQARNLALLLLAVISLSACAEQFGIGGDSWKEEVLLHDGQKIIVERYTLRGGRHVIGQMGDYIEQKLSFTLPGTGQTIEWIDNRSEDLANSSFLPMLLDIAKGTSYLVAKPMGCLSYNKWGRPNPPYVVFKYVANAWQRIPLEDLPLEIKTPNLVQSSPDLVAAQQDQRFVTAQKITDLLAETQQPEYKTILREPMDYTDCRVPMVTNGKGLWLSRERFSTRPTLEACLVECKTKKFDDNTCPCNNIFEGK